MSFVARFDSIRLEYNSTSESEFQVFTVYCFTMENKNQIEIESYFDYDIITYENYTNVLSRDSKYTKRGIKEDNNYYCNLKPEYKGKKCKVTYEVK